MSALEAVVYIVMFLAACITILLVFTIGIMAKSGRFDRNPHQETDQ